MQQVNLSALAKIQAPKIVALCFDDSSGDFIELLKIKPMVRITASERIIYIEILSLLRKIKDLRAFY